MATKEVRVCDVFGTHKDVNAVKVLVCNGDDEVLLERSVDLSPRAVERLLKKVAQGTTSPGTQFPKE